ncbi:MAG: glutamyl-tRNA reductase [Alphaproteobacteria bacterium]|nr:glutamyl-tRNA reductase [Alphaproteobacteria bacterium]
MAGAGLAGGGLGRLVVVGFGHRTCPAPLRERLYVEDVAVPSVLADMAGAGIEQALILSTCDRVEMHAVSTLGITDTAATFAAAVGRGAQLPADEIGGMTYRLTGAEALRHIFAVAASLDSRTIGEPQVLGQLRASHRLARDAGHVGPELETLLQAAYGAAKRVRNETTLAERPVSMAAVAVRLARDVHGNLANCGGVLLGGEDMGELLAEQLVSAGLGRLTVVARTERRGAAQAARLKCHFATTATLAQTLVDADVIVSAFGDGRHVVTGEMVEAVLRQRRRRPIFVIDASMPGDVEPAVGRLDEAFVYDLNDLERLALEGRQTRAAATGPAWAIVDAELAAFQRDLAERRTVPALVALRARFEELRREVLSAGDADVARATERLINRLLHDPSEGLKTLAAENPPASAEYAEALLRRLFRLEPSPDQSGDAAGISPPDRKGAVKP